MPHPTSILPNPGCHAPLRLWVLCDGKPGHENQSLGLAEAMSRMTSCEIHRLQLPANAGWFRRTRAAVKLAKSLPAPHFIFGAGHATHAPLWWLARRTHATSVVLMKPSLPISWFDVCIAPQHDFPSKTPPANLIQTRGALNRVLPGPPQRQGKLILVGGPSKTHGWDGQKLLQQLSAITRGSGPWQLTDSRRTPNGFLSAARQVLPGVSFHPHASTPPGWVPSQLAQSSEVWVTEDSVSMIYEALTSGARVGLLPSPRIKSRSRVLSGLDTLIEEGFLTPFASWQASGKLHHQPVPLREADRCAQQLLQACQRGPR